MTTLTRALLLAFLLVAPAAAQSLHKDSELGFQLRVPKGWKKATLLDREKWIVARYHDKRDYRAKGDAWGSHTPEMKVIVFPKAVTEKKEGPAVREDEDGKIRIRLGRQNPYKNFGEYLKSNSYGGYYISEEKKLTHRGMETTFQEIKYEKLTVARRAWAWIIHEEDADWVVYYEALEDWWKKLSPAYKRSFKSFKFIARTGSILEKHAGSTGQDDIVIDLGDKGEEKSPEERAEERAKDRKMRFERAVSTAEDELDDGWRIQKSKNYVAITHVDAKYTKRQLDQAEAIRRWLEKKFDWISDAEAERGLLRICRDYDEYANVARGSRDIAFSAFLSSGSFEILTYKEVGKQNWQSATLNSGVTNLWFRDKNPELSWGMPSWLETGIDNMLSSSYVKGSKLVFKPDEWDVRSLRELARNDDLMPPRELMKMTTQRFYQAEGSSAQAGAFMRFLTDGPKAKTKGFLETYVQALEFVMEEEKKKEEADRKKNDGKELSEEEKEAEQEARFKARKQRESKRIENTFDIAFGEWSEKKWAKFEKAYFDFVK